MAKGISPCVLILCNVIWSKPNLFCVKKLNLLEIICLSLREIYLVEMYVDRKVYLV